MIPEFFNSADYTVVRVQQNDDPDRRSIESSASLCIKNRNYDEVYIVAFDEQLQYNVNFIAGLESQENADLWTVIPYKTITLTNENETPVLLWKPTVSKTVPELLHPGTLRFLQPIPSFGVLADLVGTVQDWESIWESVKTSSLPIIQQMFSDLINPDVIVSEDRLQSRLSGLVLFLGSRINQALYLVNLKDRVVGGLLAKSMYDIRGNPDPSYLRLTDQRYVLTTEAKLERELQKGCHWSSQERGCQALLAMYSTHAPLLLYSQCRFKLLVENQSRNAVFTFPFDNQPSSSQYENSNLMHPLNQDTMETFIKMLIILLSADSGQRKDIKPSYEQYLETKKLETNQGHFTPENEDTLSRSNFPRRSLRLQMKKASQSSTQHVGKQMTLELPCQAQPLQNPSSSTSSAGTLTDTDVPKFVTGFTNAGVPIYKELRVYQQCIKDMIAKEEWQKIVDSSSSYDTDSEEDMTF